MLGLVTHVDGTPVGRFDVAATVLDNPEQRLLPLVSPIADVSIGEHKDSHRVEAFLLNVVHHYAGVSTTAALGLGGLC